MPTVQLFGWEGEFNIAADVFHALSHNPGVDSNTTEADAMVPWSIAGTFSNLVCRVIATDRAASTYVTRIDGADGNIVVTVAASTPGTYEDTTNSDTISGGEALAISLTLGAGTTFIEGPQSIQFAPSSGTAFRMSAGSQANLSSTSPYFFAPFGGQQTGSFTESHYQVKTAAGVWSHLALRMRTNTRGTATNVKSRVGGADGNQIIAVPAGTTGSFEDTTNSDTLSDDDLICITVENGAGGGNFRTQWCGTELAPTAAYLLGVGRGGGGQTFGTGSPLFNAPGGYLGPGYTTESDAQAKVTQDATLSNLRTVVFSNGATADSSVRSRINGVDGNLLVPITGATTGAFEDTTNSDTLVEDDLLNWEIEIGSGGTGAAQLTTIAGWLTPAAAPAAPDAWYPVVAPARLAHPARRGGGWIPPSTPAIQARAA